MKICHIITRMDRGGAPDIVRLLAEKMDPARFEVTLIYGTTVVASQKSREFLSRLGERAILVPALGRNIAPLRDLQAFFQIFRILKNGAFDLVHTHTAKAGVLGRIAAKCAGVKRVVYSPHGHDFYGYFGVIGSFLVVVAERIAALFCDKIHVLTELEKKDMLSFKICPASKLEVIASGVETEELRPSPGVLDRIKAVFSFQEKAYSVGIIGRLEPVKGVRYFIEAAKIIAPRMKSVKFFVVGDGSLRQELEKTVEDTGLKDRFVFLGWREEVSSILMTLDLVVLASLNEAVGRSLLEAQAAGVPVVATRVGGVPEVVLDRVTGLLVEPRDARALADAIVFLLQDDAKRKDMAAAAQGWVDEKFSARLMAHKFEELYERLQAAD